MFIEYRCAACGNPSGDFEFMIDPCRKCGCPEKTAGVSFGIAMEVESSPRYQQWFHSESTQAKLKSGEYSILSKSDDANHQ